MVRSMAAWFRFEYGLQRRVLGLKINRAMYGGPCKMQARIHALAIECFKLLRPVNKELMSSDDLLLGKPALVNDAHSTYELAEVAPVFLWQKSIK